MIHRLVRGGRDAPAAAAGRIDRARRGAPAADRSAPAPPWLRMAVAVPDEGQVARPQTSRRGRESRRIAQHMAHSRAATSRSTAKNMVFADGNPAADAMSSARRPAVTRICRVCRLSAAPTIAGHDLAAIGRLAVRLDRQRDRGGARRATARSTPHETEICRPFVERQIALAKPKVLVTPGSAVGQAGPSVQDGTLQAARQLEGAMSRRSGTGLSRSCRTSTPAIRRRTRRQETCVAGLPGGQGEARPRSIRPPTPR